MKIEKIIGNDDHAIVKIQRGESIMNSEENNRTEMLSRAEKLHARLEPILREATRRPRLRSLALLRQVDVQSVLELIELNAEIISLQNGSIARYQEINRHQLALRKKQFDRFEQAVKTNVEIREKYEQEQRVSQCLRNRCESLEKAEKSNKEMSATDRALTWSNAAREAIQDAEDAIMEHDDLRAARGILLSCAIGLLIWFVLLQIL